MDDLPAPEWMAFGDQNTTRMLYIFHHEDDQKPDNYVYREDMTVLGFGRENGQETTKHLTTKQSFSIGFVESQDYSEVELAIKELLENVTK
jgi:hypothetical protein